MRRAENCSAQMPCYSILKHSLVSTSNSRFYFCTFFLCQWNFGMWTWFVGDNIFTGPTGRKYSQWAQETNSFYPFLFHVENNYIKKKPIIFPNTKSQVPNPSSRTLFNFPESISFQPLPFSLLTFSSTSSHYPHIPYSFPP